MYDGELSCEKGAGVTSTLLFLLMNLVGDLDLDLEIDRDLG